MIIETRPRDSSIGSFSSEFSRKSTAICRLIRTAELQINLGLFATETRNLARAQTEGGKLHTRPRVFITFSRGRVTFSRHNPEVSRPWAPLAGHFSDPPSGQKEPPLPTGQPSPVCFNAKRLNPRRLFLPVVLSLPLSLCLLVSRVFA